MRWSNETRAIVIGTHPAAQSVIVRIVWTTSAAIPMRVVTPEDMNDWKKNIWEINRQERLCNTQKKNKMETSIG